MGLVSVLWTTFVVRTTFWETEGTEAKLPEENEGESETETGVAKN